MEETKAKDRQIEKPQTEAVGGQSELETAYLLYEPAL
jgi:hypothetical protein